MERHNLEGREWLISGGSGSLGQALTRRIILDKKPKGIRIFSRDELKQWQMRRALDHEFPNAPLAYLIGDVKDQSRIDRALQGVDVVVHAAALKQVPACEENPIEAVKTNVQGTVNVIEACLNTKVDRALLISTDKAVMPINLYGATKMTAEKVWAHANTYSGGRSPVFAAVRYGNVLGSRGSVLQRWKEQITADRPLTLTNGGATRFWILLDEVCSFIFDALEDARGGEVFVPRMPSCSMRELALLMSAKPVGIEESADGLRHGEKMHETLICLDEVPRSCCEIKSGRDRYVIMPTEEAWWSVDWRQRGDAIGAPIESSSSRDFDWVLRKLNQGGLI